MTRRIRYAAQVPRVKDVILSGSADLNYWRDRLEPLGMTPKSASGRAQIQIVGGDLVWAKIPFQELSVGISVTGLDDPDGQGVLDEAVLILQAFNSSRLFTFFERHWFGTPYVRSRVDVQSTAPCTIGVRTASGESFRAAMGSELDGRVVTEADVSWTGAIYLPRSTPERQLYFIGSLRGFGQSFGFAAEDQIDFGRDARTPIFRQLEESEFTGESWLLRADAIHARTKTYRRRIS